MLEQHAFMDRMIGSHDFDEAISAHKEKRKPQFNGQ